MVVTERPETSVNRVWQENARLPSTCTMQAPHIPAPQPNLVPVSFSSSRNTQSRRVSGGAFTFTCLPFSLNEVAIIASLRFTAPKEPRPAAAVDLRARLHPEGRP